MDSLHSCDTGPSQIMRMCSLWATVAMSRATRRKKAGTEPKLTCLL